MNGIPVVDTWIQQGPAIFEQWREASRARSRKELELKREIITQGAYMLRVVFKYKTTGEIPREREWAAACICLLDDCSPDWQYTQTVWRRLDYIRPTDLAAEDLSQDNCYLVLQKLHSMGLIEGKKAKDGENENQKDPWTWKRKDL